MNSLINSINHADIMYNIMLIFNKIDFSMMCVPIIYSKKPNKTEYLTFSQKPGIGKKTSSPS